MAKLARIVFIGDIVGRPGRDAVKALLPGLRDAYSPDIVIANGENSAGGFGITPDISEELFSLGIDVITTGNHVWDKKEIYEYISETPRLLRPANFSSKSFGKGSCVFIAESGIRIGVLNVSGRVFMDSIDCPFRVAEAEVKALKESADIIIVDMHAEATSEKAALAWFLDGQVTAVIGTHTHVQTSDEAIFPDGTAFISDAGMTGPTHSILGMKKEIVIERFLTGLPARFEVARSGVELQGAYVEVDTLTGKATKIERIRQSVNL
jgi:hypothetical protein